MLIICLGTCLKFVFENHPEPSIMVSTYLKWFCGSIWVYKSCWEFAPIMDINPCDIGLCYLVIEQIYVRCTRHVGNGICQFPIVLGYMDVSWNFSIYDKNQLMIIHNMHLKTMKCSSGTMTLELEKFRG